MADEVDHPKHYNQVPGVECIDVVKHFNFQRGNAIKYLWRAGEKGDPVRDLQKAMWYIESEIADIIEARGAVNSFGRDSLQSDEPTRQGVSVQGNPYPSGSRLL